MDKKLTTRKHMSLFTAERKPHARCREDPQHMRSNRPPGRKATAHITYTARTRVMRTHRAPAGGTLSAPPRARPAGAHLSRSVPLVENGHLLKVRHDAMRLALPPRTQDHRRGVDLRQL